MKQLRQKLLSTLLLLPFMVSAAAEEKPMPMPVDPLSVSSIANMLMGLGLVLAIIFIMAWVVKRMGGMQLAGSQQLKILAGLSLGAREKVILIQVENKRMVLGVAQGQVNALHVFDGDYDNVENTTNITATDFKEKMLQALNNTLKNKPAEK
ncbi:MAG: flagellar biosynthetic protein FliO [Gammaproteobacteria bacterium]|nr:flagellar biosynthetic protein FliO [Gammaproteobacteria bacterium]